MKKNYYFEEKFKQFYTENTIESMIIKTKNIKSYRLELVHNKGGAQIYVFSNAGIDENDMQNIFKSDMTNDREYYYVCTIYYNDYKNALNDLKDIDENNFSEYLEEAL